MRKNRKALRKRVEHIVILIGLLTALLTFLAAFLDFSSQATPAPLTLIVNAPSTNSPNVGSLLEVEFERWDEPYGVYSIQLPKNFFEIEEVRPYEPYPYIFFTDEIHMQITYGGILYSGDISDENWVNHRITSNQGLHFHKPNSYVTIPWITTLVSQIDTGRYERSRVYEFQGDNVDGRMTLLWFIEEREGVYFEITIIGPTEKFSKYRELFESIYLSLGWSPIQAKEAISAPFH